MLHNDKWDVIPGIFLMFFWIFVMTLCVISIVMFAPHHHQAVALTVILGVAETLMQVSWLLWRADWTGFF